MPTYQSNAFVSSVLNNKKKTPQQILGQAALSTSPSNQSAAQTSTQPASQTQSRTVTTGRGSSSSFVTQTLSDQPKSATDVLDQASTSIGSAPNQVASSLPSGTAVGSAPGGGVLFVDNDKTTTPMYPVASTDSGGQIYAPIKQPQQQAIPQTSPQQQAIPQTSPQQLHPIPTSWNEFKTGYEQGVDVFANYVSNKTPGLSSGEKSFESGLIYGVFTTPVEHPVEFGIAAGIGFGLPIALAGGGYAATYGLTEAGVSAASLSRIGTVTKYAVIGTGVGLTGLYAAEKGTDIYTGYVMGGPKEAGKITGGAITGDILSFATGSYLGVKAIESKTITSAISGLRTSGLTEVPTKDVVAPEYFQGQKYPGISQGETAGQLLNEFKPMPDIFPGETKAAGFTAAPTTIKGDTVMEGSSELPGLYQAPKLSPTFLKVQSESKVKLFSFDLPGVKEPTAYRITPNEFKLPPDLLPNQNTFYSSKSAKDFFNTNAEKGNSYVTFIKSEKESIIPFDTKIQQTQTRNFFKFEDVNIPIKEAQTVYGGKSTNFNFKDNISSKDISIKDLYSSSGYGRRSGAINPSLGFSLSYSNNIMSSSSSYPSFNSSSFNLNSSSFNLNSPSSSKSKSSKSYSSFSSISSVGSFGRSSSSGGSSYPYSSSSWSGSSSSGGSGYSYGGSFGGRRSFSIPPINFGLNGKNNKSYRKQGKPPGYDFTPDFSSVALGITGKTTKGRYLKGIKTGRIAGYGLGLRKIPIFTKVKIK
jgi:hypothetical protein